MCKCILILNIDICSLFVRIDSVAMKPEWKLHFLEWKVRSSVLNLVPGILEIQGFGIPQFSGGTHPRPPTRRGLTAPCWHSRLLYSNLLTTSVIIETTELCIVQNYYLDVIIFKIYIWSNPHQSPTSPQIGGTKMRQSPTNLGLKELPITDQIPTKAQHIPGWAGFTLNGA